ncbi:MAG TPA: hypothetical protein VK604_05075 [Bryobacteraceae bacterium]|nr:hypothetical protein [Bryobacteraceae bacterium]
MSPTRLEIADVFRQHEKEFFAKWGSQLTAQQAEGIPGYLRLSHRRLRSTP